MPDMSRIFWLGMHKVLKPTELRRLRSLGHEVFNPAYLSPVYDQSADMTVDRDQPTSLPQDVFDTLLAYDFFYRPIDGHIADILNTYFDTIIVTINFLWLKEIAKVYNGRLIYRVFGQGYLLSDKIIEVGAWPFLFDRPDFHIVPFSEESIENEHRWFVDRVSEIVPYQIPDDVFEHSACWGDARLEEIATIFPNVQNEYYANAYASFAARFHESFFRIYGPQRAHPRDNRFVGALPRSTYLDSLARSSGFYYDYRDGVCYLPPIESMQLGVPVVCAKGSLLARFLGPSPNVALDDQDARSKVLRLLSGDRGLAAELIAAQEPARQRYDRSLVQWKFEGSFRRLLSRPVEAEPRAANVVTKRSKKIVIPLHLDGLFRHRHGHPYAFEGIPRVVDIIVRTVTAQSNVGCLISCTSASEPIMYDFFREEIRRGAVELYVMQAASPGGSQLFADIEARLGFIEWIDQNPSITSVLVPHYYLFPEVFLSKKRSVLYLPDYFPHMMPDVAFDSSFERDNNNKIAGVAHARHADFILTNSEFTKGYLVDAGFVKKAELEKVLVAPLPFLGSGRAEELSAEEVDLLHIEIGDQPFLFYPTANRPNKRLDFLLDLYADLLKTTPSLALVLTGSLDTYAPVRVRASQLGLADRVTLLHHASEGILRWLYENCKAVCLTTVLEGNFPPQMLEALNYGAPVVATRLPTITEILGDRSEDLLLCRPLDRDDFMAKIAVAFANREAVVERQNGVARDLQRWNSAHAFGARLRVAFPEMDACEAAACA